MADKTPFIVPVDTLEEGPNGSDPKEPPVEMNTSRPATENHILDHTSGNASNDVVRDLIMQFVVQNFEQINAMYSAFSPKRKEINYTSQFSDDNLSDMGPWNADMEGLPERAAQKTPEEIAISKKPSKKNRTIADNWNGLHKQNLVTNSDFYNVAFTFKETEMNVPTHLKTYDGMSDPVDHLMIFMGTMDVHKLPEPAWCRFFHITLCGAARFWYDNLSPGSINSFHKSRDNFRANFLQQRRFQKTQAEILGIRQRSDEWLRDYLGRFGKETLHMTDRSDGMMTGAFIKGLRPGRFFKDLIARPPALMEDLSTQAHNFIRANEANIENQLQDSK
ncbi:gag protein [Tanacetum coccineum]